MPNPVTAVEAADPATALRHFAGRLAVETDVADVAAALAAGGDPGFVLLDARSPESYAAGHLPGARLLPRPFAAEDVAALGDALLVVYCWGPACNGATKAARGARRARPPGQGDDRRIRVLGARRSRRL